jgi:hypothetical protein
MLRFRLIRQHKDKLICFADTVVSPTYPNERLEYPPMDYDGPPVAEHASCCERDINVIIS